MSNPHALINDERQTMIAEQRAILVKKQNQHFLSLVLFILGICFYFLFYFSHFGIDLERLFRGLSQLDTYFSRMFIWKNVAQWPFAYYIQQIFITLAIVFSATLFASICALFLSFLTARNIMRGRLRPIAWIIRNILNIIRSIDVLIWGMIFVRALGLGPLAGVLALFMQDLSMLTKLYAEAHEATDEKPRMGICALGASPYQQIRYGLFTQSFPTFVSLTLYELESNTRSAAILGFVGAGGIGLVYAENMRLWHWDVVTFITLCLVIILVIFDKLSQWLRDKLTT